MSESKRLPRLYDEREVGKILERATELQQREPSRAPQGHASGFSLGELEEIALEAGIDPRFMRRAAAELETGAKGATPWDRVAGERLTLLGEERVEGELTDEGFERVVQAIQLNAEEHGQPSLLGRTLTWRAESANKSRTIQITVSSRNGETHIRAEERLHQMAAGILAGSTLGAGAGIGVGVGLPVAIEVLGSTLAAVAFPVGIVALSYIVAREAYRMVVARRRTALSRLVHAVAVEAEAAIADVQPDADRPPELPRG